MNIFKILENIEKVDAEVYDRLDTRRAAMSQFANLGKKLSLAALPLGMGAMFNKAYGQSMPSDVMDALQLALAAEYLESTYYALGIRYADSLGMTGKLKVGIAKISLDELSHIEAVKATIIALGGTPLRPGEASDMTKDYGIDITGGGGSGNGPFTAALESLENFLAAAQGFEDFGVRAYKGQAARVMSNNDVLRAALDIHAVEARHASFLRTSRMRYGMAPSGLKPWITLKNPYMPSSLAAALQPIYEAGTDASMYPAEDNTTQAGISLTNVLGADGMTAISAAAVSEAFDEPLDKPALLAIVGTPGSGMGSPNAKFFY